MQRLMILLATCSISMSVSGAALAQSPGELDPAFGLEAGLTATAMPGGPLATSLVVLSDGGWVVSGFVTVEEPSGQRARPILTRYRADGVPLTSFGINGVASSTATVPLDNDPKVLFDGIRLYQLVVESPQIRVLAYTLQGHPDLTYGVGGVATVPAGVGVIGVQDAVLQEGRVLIAGGGHDGSSPYGSQFLLARLTPSGQPDFTFGSGGRSYYGILGSSAGTHHSLTGVTLQPDGKIVAAGYTTAPPYVHTDMAVVRFLSNGKPDKTFGDEAFRVFSLLDRNWSGNVVVQSDGKVVVAGTICADGDGVTASVFCMMGAARLLPNGNFDLGFGAGGRAMHWLPPSGGQPASMSTAYTIDVDPQGRVLFFGTAWDDAPSAFIARLTSDGSLDSTFGEGGVVRDAYGDASGSSMGAGQLLRLPSGAHRLITAGMRHAGPAALVIARHFYDDAATGAASK